MPTQTLLNHAIYGDLSVDALREIFSKSTTSVLSATLSGADVFLGFASGAIFIKSPGTGTRGAGIDTPDLAICGGIVHLIDTVLLPTRPEGPAAELPDGTDGMEAPAEGPGADGPGAEGPGANSPGDAPDSGGEAGLGPAPAQAPAPAPAPKASLRSPPGQGSNPPQLEVWRAAVLWSVRWDVCLLGRPSRKIAPNLRFYFS